MKAERILDATAFIGGIAIGWYIAEKLEQGRGREAFPYRNEDEIRRAQARGAQLDAADMSRRYGEFQ